MYVYICIYLSTVQIPCLVPSSLSLEEREDVTRIIDFCSNPKRLGEKVKDLFYLILKVHGQNWMQFSLNYLGY